MFYVGKTVKLPNLQPPKSLRWWIAGVGSLMYVECPGGFTFLGNFSTDALLTGSGVVFLLLKQQSRQLLDEFEKMIRWGQWYFFEGPGFGMFWNAFPCQKSSQRSVKVLPSVNPTKQSMISTNMFLKDSCQNFMVNSSLYKLGSWKFRFCWTPWQTSSFMVPMAHRRSRWKFGNWKSNDTQRQVTGGSIAIDSSSTTRVVVWFSWKEPTKKSEKMIPTWEVFTSFGNCETVFQLWLDKIGLSNSWKGKILSCTTRPISFSSFCASQLLHRILHLWFAGSEHLCSHQMCSKVQVQIVACSKGLVNGLLDDSLSIEFGANTSLMCFRGSRHKNIERTMATKLRAGVIDWLPNSIPLFSMCCCSNHLE